MNDNKLDDTLNIVAGFDWITPTVYILQDFFNGPVARFGIMANAGFDRRDIKQMLSKHSIKSWGYVYNVAGDMIMLSVPKHSAQYANYVLMRAGVPILFAPNAESTKPATELGSVVKFGKMKIVKRKRLVR